MNHESVFNKVGAYFLLGIDALAKGDRTKAKVYFLVCKQDGFLVLYMTQLSRAFLGKLENDKTWPEWIE